MGAVLRPWRIGDSIVRGTRSGAKTMVIRFLHFISFVIVAALLFASPVEAKWGTGTGPAVNVVIDISSQSMSVKVHGWPYGRWKVSTARPGYHTPRGTFRVQRTAKV